MSTGEDAGSISSPWRRTSGSFRVVSITVLVGLSSSFPVSRKRAIMFFLLSLVYFCQSARE